MLNWQANVYWEEVRKIPVALQSPAISSNCIRTSTLNPAFLIAGSNMQYVPLPSPMLRSLENYSRTPF